MSEIKCIDFLIPNTSQYEVLHHFTHKLYEAFQRQGITCRLLEGDERHQIPINDPPDLLIGFNGVYRTPEGEFICDTIETPYLSILVDPPNRFYPITQSPHTILACDDRDSCRVLQQAGFQRHLFMAHAVEPELSPPVPRKPFYDVVMLNTFIDYEKRRESWSKMFPKGVPEIMDLAVELTFEDESLPFMYAFEKALNAWMRRGGMVDPRQLDFFKIFEQLELFIKGKDRIELLRSLTDVNVHVWGASMDERTWETLFYGSPNIIPHAAVDYHEALEIMKHSKVVLSSNIKNKQGAHERIFAGNAAGAVVATTACPYIKEKYTDGEDIILYNPSDYEALNKTLKELISDDSKREAIANKGRDTTMKFHTWDHRAAALLKKLPDFLLYATG